MMIFGQKEWSKDNHQHQWQVVSINNANNMVQLNEQNGECTRNASLDYCRTNDIDN